MVQFSLMHLFPCLEMENNLRALHLPSQRRQFGQMDVKGLICGDKRWAGHGVQHPDTSRGLVVLVCTPEGCYPHSPPHQCCSWDDVWIRHRTSGISINFQALQSLLTFPEMQREIEVINLAGRGGSSTLPFPVRYMGWGGWQDPFASMQSDAEHPHAGGVTAPLCKPLGHSQAVGTGNGTNTSNSEPQTCAQQLHPCGGTECVPPSTRKQPALL